MRSGGDWHPSPMLKRGLGEGNNRRLPNGKQVNRLAALSLKRSKSVDFGGYWSLKIMSPVSMTKPYFVSECRVAGFIRTLLSGLARSIKTM